MNTHSDFLTARAESKERRKALEADLMRIDRETTARAWTTDQAKKQVARDVADHADMATLGKNGLGSSYYLRSDMAMQAGVNAAYDVELKAVAPDLYARVQQNEKENIPVYPMASLAAAKTNGMRLG